MELLKELMGRLHPVIVHLPIGFIILGLLLQVLDRRKKEFIKLIPVIFLWGAVLALAACLTGYLQYLGEGYAFDTVRTHLWFAIATAVFAFVMYLRLVAYPGVRRLNSLPTVVLSVILLFLISLTGHLGGSITHGEDYLVEPLPNSVKKALGFAVYEKQLISLSDENWEDSHVYGDIIAPILNNNCVSCHNPKKSKGQLHLNTPEGILKGGENGDVIIPKDPDESPLYARLMLPRQHEDHMPPKGKEQPAREEIALIRAWIQKGSPFDSTIRELNLPKFLLEPFFARKPNRDYPETAVEAASGDSIKLIKSQGIHIDRISETSNYLSVSCLNKPTFSDADLDLLRPVRLQIALLDLGGTRITDASMEKLAALPNLTMLKLDRTAITGKDIILLNKLENLRVLNLTATPFQKIYLPDLKTFKKLRAAYLYKTGLSSGDAPGGFRDSVLHLEFGNYALPALPSDGITY